MYSLMSMRTCVHAQRQKSVVLVHSFKSLRTHTGRHKSALPHVQLTNAKNSTLCITQFKASSYANTHHRLLSVEQERGQCLGQLCLAHTCDVKSECVCVCLYMRT